MPQLQQHSLSHSISVAGDKHHNYCVKKKTFLSSISIAIAPGAASLTMARPCFKKVDVPTSCTPVHAYPTVRVESQAVLYLVLKQCSFPVKYYSSRPDFLKSWCYGPDHSTFLTIRHDDITTDIQT
eukprot:scpid100118/ scgid21951/ 